MSVKNRAASNTFDKNAALIKDSQELLPRPNRHSYVIVLRLFQASMAERMTLRRETTGKQCRITIRDLKRRNYWTSRRRSVEEHRVTICALALDAIMHHEPFDLTE